MSGTGGNKTSSKVGVPTTVDQKVSVSTQRPVCVDVDYHFPFQLSGSGRTPDSLVPEVSPVFKSPPVFSTILLFLHFSCIMSHSLLLEVRPFIVRELFSMTDRRLKCEGIGSQSQVSPTALF